MSEARLFPRSQTERTIAAARVVLAASGLFAIWLDPAETSRSAALTYTLHSSYVMYALALAGVVWNRATAGYLPLLTQGVDIALFSIFQYLTPSPSNPFFVYFIFSLFCGSLRWQRRGTFGTALLVIPLYLLIGASVSRTIDPSSFEMNRYVIRAVYLALMAVLLEYLGQHETRLRVEIERLARWPPVGGGGREKALARVLEHAAEVIDCVYVLVAWEASDEPWMHLAARSPTGTTLRKHAPGEVDPLVPPPLADAVIVCASRLSNSTVSLINRGDVTWEWHGLPLHARLLPYVGGEGLTSAAFRTEHVSGRVFFSDLGNPTTELMWLTQVLAREIGTSVDQLHRTEQMKELAASEQRIRLARDLHDGVLQSLTGIRLEISGVAASLDAASDAGAQDRLHAIERAMAIEQRELRLFIEALKPEPRPGESFIGLTARLHSMRERLALEWKTPISLTTEPQSLSLPDHLEREILFMAHEAVVNALKHAHPSRISVDVNQDNGVVRIGVRDDGRGFAFRGRYDHAALAASKLGPVSLRERADSLGGRMSIESTDSGSTVEITLPAAGRP